ncbi:MAG: nuclear transport factor 2 family protein [Bacteroidia bacterium]|nr:nuclear transport factor 2 family protein [Bacteroidia bacterium]
MKYLLLTIGLVVCACTARSNNTATAQKIFDAFNAHDWERMMSFYDDDARFEDPAYKQAVTPQQVARHHADLEQMFPDIKDSVVHMYGFGNVVVVEFISTGTASDGQAFSLPICTVLEFDNGRVVRDATYYDNN